MLNTFFSFLNNDDADTALWTKVTTLGDGPSARFSVAGDCLDPVRGGVLVFVGGCNRSLEALEDMFYLYTGLNFMIRTFLWEFSVVLFVLMTQYALLSNSYF